MLYLITMRKEAKKITKTTQGVISISSKGTGYVRVPDCKEDPEIDSRHLNTALHGDMVEIIVDKHRQGPSDDWLTFVKTNIARTHIKNYLKKKRGSLAKIFNRRFPKSTNPS